MISPRYLSMSDTYAGKIAFAKVDVDVVPAVAQMCSVSAMPTFQFFKKGQKVDELVGADPRALEAKLIQLASL